MDDAFQAALHADGPVPDLADRIGLYAWLMGSWDLDVIGYLDDGTASQTYASMVGRRQGETIVQDGRDADGNLVRWSFSDITPAAFHWRGELSKDGGASWRLRSEFFARRAVPV